MRIGLTGAHGTGKTSVAALYSERYAVPLITSISRKVKALGYPINDEATVESQALTSMARIAQQIKAGDNFISDRTPLCSVAYNMEQMIGKWIENPAAGFWFDSMDIITYDFMPRYDLIVYFPITFSIVGDGVRSEDLQYQKQIDNNIRYLLGVYELEYAIIPDGDVEHRTEWLRKVIDKGSL